MSKSKQIMKAQSLLQEAINIASSMTDNHNMAEARQHMKQALNKINKVNEKQHSKKEANNTQQKEWWNKIVSGVSNGHHSGVSEGHHSQESFNKTLKHLNQMILEETKKLEEIEKKSQESTDQDLIEE